jgi:2'-5' RNA ligase
VVSALVVPVDLPRRFERIRRAFVPSAAVGVPAHVTLLFPFMPPEDLREADRRRIASILGGHGPIEFRLGRIRDWETVRYLDVEPGAPFIRLVETLVAAYPAWSPYGGAFPYVPHVTVAERNGVAEPVIADPRAPLPRVADRAVLLVEDTEGRWHTRWRFHLGRRR